MIIQSLVRQQDSSKIDVKSRSLSNNESFLNQRKKKQESSYKHSAQSKSQILSLVLKSSDM